MHFCQDSLDKRTCWKVQIPCQVPDGGEDSMSTGRWGTRCMVHCDPFMGTANNRGLPPTSMPFSLLGEEWRSSWIWVWLNDWIWRNYTRLYLNWIPLGWIWMDFGVRFVNRKAPRQPIYVRQLLVVALRVEDLPPWHSVGCEHRSQGGPDRGSLTVTDRGSTGGRPSLISSDPGAVKHGGSKLTTAQRPCSC